MRTRIAGSSPEDDEDTITSDGDTTDSDGDVDMEGFLAATAPKNKRLILSPPKLESSLSMENFRDIRLRLNQPEREDFEERPLPVDIPPPNVLRPSPPNPDKVEDNSHRLLSGQVRKVLAKIR